MSEAIVLSNAMSLWCRALPSDVCGVSPGNAELKAIIGGRELAVPTFPVKVVEPQPPIKITAWIVSDDENNVARQVEDVQNMIAPLNDSMPLLPEQRSSQPRHEGLATAGLP